MLTRCTTAFAANFVSKLVCGVSLLLVMVIGSAQADELRVRAGYSELLFDTELGVPVRWTVCADICGADSQHKSVLLDADSGYLHVSTLAGPGGKFSAAVAEQEQEVVVSFTDAHGAYIYRLARATPEVFLELPAGARLEVATGAAFIPEQLPGFGQIYSRVNGVQVTADGQTLFDDHEQTALKLNAVTGVWTGMRSRYWTLLLQPVDGAVEINLGYTQQDHPRFEVVSAADATATYRFYAGPLEWRALKSAAPELSEMLFAALWDFLRVLCFGMLLLLEWLQSFTGSFGLAIILLSLSNKVLMSPLTMLADRWQADVNRQHSLLKPELDAIKQSFKGEEAHKRVLAVYKDHNVSQFYTFKSAAGFLIQIPVFIAAFDMLAENIALNEIAFLWTADLAKPDQFMQLPFVLPFFGGWLNLLPFLMTALSSLAAWLQAEETLTAELQRQQSLRLYLMSAAFFVLFYTFPAGMVLYWTSSNFFHLLKVESGRLFGR